MTTGFDANGSPVKDPTIEQEAEKLAKAYYSSLSAADRLASIDFLTHHIKHWPAAYGPLVEELVALVRKDTAQKYEAIIAERVAETVAQLRPKLELDLRSAALAAAKKELRRRLEDKVRVVKAELNSVEECLYAAEDALSCLEEEI